MNTTETRSDLALLYSILKQREVNAAASTSSRRLRANLRRGADPFTETYAYPYVLPVLGNDANPRTRLALLRTAATVAEFVEITAVEENERKSFGKWCAEVSMGRRKQTTGSIGQGFSPSDPDEIANRLMYLHTQDFEEAFKSIWRIMKLASTVSPTPKFDYMSLYNLLLHWGNGISAKSRAIRMQVLKDYYSSIPFTE